LAEAFFIARYGRDAAQVHDLVGNHPRAIGGQYQRPSLPRKGSIFRYIVLLSCICVDLSVTSGRGLLLEIDQIRYFLAVCDKGNFTRAAQTCGITQPSLTIAIQRLEHSIGGKLFDRSSSSPVRLTELGSQLLPICKEIDVLFEKTVALAKFRATQTISDGRSARS
jgi:hypothetical protein